ncbi:MAG: helix-turn-helix transcriptional regulator [Clostridia bacterium]|nr:helix-turn-helix transcriptional regulator [Clostridia bacterium]
MREISFGLRLAQLRIKKGVSAREMSLSLGQNPAYINNIETGKSKPSIDVFLYICEYLEITPGEFFDFESTDPVRLRGIVANMKTLNDEQLAVIAALVKDLAKR